jgi:hypothetical protein
MTPDPSRPSREDVLDAFAVESDAGRDTLERYLRDYPEYAVELIDLSRELSRVLVEDEEPLSAEDQALIKMAWQRHMDAAPKAISDPLAALSAAELREVAQSLDVPRQVVTAFRERRVIAASVPRRFLVRFAATVNSTVDLFTSALALPPSPSLARSYKSAAKPRTDALVTFEKLLLDAGVSDEKRAQLMADDN